MGDTNTYDRFGDVYNITRILNPDITLNHTAYEEYSAMYLSPPYISLYLLTFAISTCIISHTLLYHGVTLWNSFRNIDPEEEDIHAKLMKAYPEVPNWWYWCVVCLFFIIAVVSVQVSLNGLSKLIRVADSILCRYSPHKCRSTHSFYHSLSLLSICYPLVSSLLSLVNRYAGSWHSDAHNWPLYQLSLNVLAQVIPGALLPGNPIANMVSFYSQMKMNWHSKPPPRSSNATALRRSTLRKCSHKIWN